MVVTQYITYFILILYSKHNGMPSTMTKVFIHQLQLLHVSALVLGAIYRKLRFLLYMCATYRTKISTCQLQTSKKRNNEDGAKNRARNQVEIIISESKHCVTSRCKVL
jgi:hypothetical protein